MSEPKFLVCKNCGNVAEMLYDCGVQMICCGDYMENLEPGVSDGAVEKHVPVCKVEGNIIEVQVGQVAHPMLPEHYIGWIWLETKNGGSRRELEAGDEPKAVFTLAPGDEAVAVYAWCNLHGLWKTEIK